MYIHMYSGLKPPPGKITRAVSVLVPIIRPFIAKLPPPLPFTPTTRLDFSLTIVLTISACYICWFAISWPISLLFSNFSTSDILFLKNLRFTCWDMDKRKLFYFMEYIYSQMSSKFFSYFFRTKVRPKILFSSRSWLIKSAMQEHILLLVKKVNMREETWTSRRTIGAKVEG